MSASFIPTWICAGARIPFIAIPPLSLKNEHKKSTLHFAKCLCV
nr:MAG TPA: hypothetical protein [Caudoviricetes sp.]